MGMNPGPNDVLISGWFFISLAAILIIARIYLRLVIQKRRLIISDVLMVAAWVAVVIHMVVVMELIQVHALDKGVNTLLQHYTGRPEDIPLIFKLIWVSSIPFWITTYLCRAALLAMYLQIFPECMRKRRAFLWGTIVYTAIAFVASFLLLFLICLPIESNWDLSPERTCPTSLGVLTVQISWALSIVSDILIFILPFTIIYRLNMRKSLKAGIYFTFLLGIVNITVDTLRFVTIMVVQVEGHVVPIATVALWAILDSTIAVVIACLPSLRPYFSASGGEETGRSSKPHPHAASSATLKSSGAESNRQSESCGETINSDGSRDSYNMHEIRRPSNTLSIA